MERAGLEVDEEHGDVEMHGDAEKLAAALATDLRQQHNIIFSLYGSPDNQPSLLDDKFKLFESIEVSLRVQVQHAGPILTCDCW